jgi:Predicted integral membrane protein (DUF2269)
MRNWLLFFHILGAAGWVGGGLYGWISTTQLARNPGRIGKSLEIISSAGNRFFGPFVGLTVLSGIALVWTEAAWSWSDAFVLIGLGAVLFSGAWQPLVAQKADIALIEKASAGGDASEELVAYNRSAVIELAVLLFVLWSMVFKLGAG